MDIRNCKNCGRLYNYFGKMLCPECMKKLDDDFTKVKKYLRENPNASIAVVAEENDVSVKQIRDWIREERLIVSEGQAIGITCDACGKPIRTGKFCNDCRTKVTKDLKGVQMAQNPMQEREGVKSSSRDRMRYLNQDKK